MRPARLDLQFGQSQAKKRGKLKMSDKDNQTMSLRTLRTSSNMSFLTPIPDLKKKIPLHFEQ